MPVNESIAAEVVTAAQQGLALCHACELLTPLSGHSHCPRCGASLHLRKPDSINRTLALLIAAFALYIPANILPVMETRSMFGVQQDTIMSGVAFLWTSGSWVLACVVFLASVTVPLLKLISLALLVVSVHFGAHWRPRQRTQLYRLLELIGRWSMLDVYVVTLLVALVQAQSLASILPGPGVVAFGAVVVLSMLAAMNFDSRLLWDAMKTNKQERSDQ
jgi:paraquat-inducible protein A